MAKYLDDTGLRHLLTKLATKEEVTNADTKVGDLNGLQTNSKDKVVNAINELKTDTTSIDGKIGVLTNLNTAHKDTVVGAINEVNTGLGGKADKSTSLDGYGIENAYTKDETDAAIKVVSDKVGDLGVLTTTDTNSIVGAINELKTAVNTADTEIGDLGTLITGAKDSLVNAINEIEGQVDALQRGTYDDTPLREMIGTVTNLDTDNKTNLVVAVNELHTELGTKANSETTLAGYGIADAYTKDETDTKIAEALANASNLKREIKDTLPSTQDANEHTIYMIKKIGGSGDQNYDEYMLINGAFEKIGDSTVVLTDYALKTEVATAKREAVDEAKAYADGLAVNYDRAGSATAAETNAKQYADQKFAEITSIGNGEIDAMFTP